MDLNGFLAACASFVMEYKYIILFYLIVLVVIYLNRKKFIFQSKVIAMYKTKWGISWMEQASKKHGELIKIIGYTGIGAGFLGMLIIFGFVLKGIYNLIFLPSAPAVFSLVIPGVRIPGSPIFVPFWYGIIALFFVVAIHEFCHGIVAKSHGLKIESTGIVFFGPLIGAFVEPDEKQVVKKDDVVQMSIFAAGPFANMLLAALVLIITGFILTPIQSSMVEFKGVSFEKIEANYPAEKAGVQAGVQYDVINGQNVSNSDEFITVLNCAKPGDTVTLSSQNLTNTIVTAQSPADPKKAYLGVQGLTSQYELKSHSWWYVSLFNFLFILNNPFANSIVEYTLLQWIIMLSLGIGLANLLPLGPVDGGRMIQLALVRIYGKAKGMKYWMNLSILVFIAVICLIFIPMIMKGIIPWIQSVF